MRAFLPGAMTDELQLHATALARLHRLGGDALVRKMIGTFRAYTPGLEATLRRAAEAGDLPAAAEAAHSMRSAAGNVGAMRLEALARDAEALARGGDGARLRPAAAEVSVALALVTEALVAIAGEEEGK